MRVPALDGLRGVSIGLVVLGHLGGKAGFPEVISDSWIAKLSVFGVEIFFGISGFIITHLLLAERALTGTVSLRRFYMRRVIRIVPACYVLVAFIVCLAAFVPIYMPLSGILAALTFTTNVWIEAGTWYLGHTWSLAVEEQFYLLWPATFVIIAAWPPPRIVRMLVYVLAASVPVSVLAKLNLFPNWLAGLFEPAFPIYAGCLLAILHQSYPTELAAFYQRRVASFALVVLMSVAVSLSVAHVTGRFAAITVPARVLVVSIAAAYLVGYVILKRGWLQRILNARPLVYIGTISYSLYLWQQVFLTDDRSAWDQALGSWPQRVLLLTGAALLSFYLVERPLWRLRENLRPRP